MKTTSLDDNQLKALFKEALVELLEERQDLFYGLFADAITDLALVNAIIEGEPTDTVAREEIFRILEGES